MEIEFYQDDDGRRPVQEFLDSLKPKMRASMVDKIRYLQEVGHLIRPPKSKHLIDGIYELRAQAEGDITRVLYFFVVGNKAVLTHGFIKKTKKTPPEEIARAESSRQRYMEQKRKEDTSHG
ncbi:MAG: type II toxin-antitoxin system RelE/ParE family toxin [Victivallales bacterium]|nr:type II toxin-antitoxin system RelE/ParE family toxin [Victivallales bacterium]